MDNLSLPFSWYHHTHQERCADAKGNTVALHEQYKDEQDMLLAFLKLAREM